MKKYNIAVLGATGAVGREMLKVIEEYQIPVGTLLPLASAKSAGTEIDFMGGKVKVQEATEESFQGMDYVLGAVQNPMSKKFAPAIVRSGAVYIDNSSAFRMDPDVPLVVPEINGEDAFQNKGIIANPNCSTIITMMAAAPIARISPIRKITATTFQAVSGAGIGGLQELNAQVQAIHDGKEPEIKVFPQQIAFNCIAEIGSYNENGYTAEEMKMQNEGRRILHLPDLKVTCTCVRVPVYRSHSISFTAVTEDKVTVGQARDAIMNAEGTKLVEDHVPSPLETSNQDIVYVGRIREDLCEEKGLAMWCCGDQIRKGAAANAVQIMEYLLSH